MIGSKKRKTVYKILCALICIILTAGILSADAMAEEKATVNAIAEVDRTCNTTISLTENRGERAVTWWAPADTTKSVLKYSKNQDLSEAVTVNGTCTLEQSGFKSYEARMNKLEENEYYYYQIMSTGGLKSTSSELKRIYVADDSVSNSEFSFIYMGDAQCQNSNPAVVEADYASWGKALKAAAAQRDEARLGFCMMGGDMVNDGQDPYEWNEYLKNGSQTFSTLNMMSINGNHECNDTSTYKPTMYKQLFDMPKNGPAGFEEEFYSFDYGSCHIQAVNSDVFEQLSNGKITQNDMDRIEQWMKDDLADSAAEWKIVVTHHPAYAVVSDNIAAQVLEKWSPIFDEAAVDLVLCGHQHVYMRSKKMLGKQVDERNGVTYVMGVSGSKMYSDNSAPYAEVVIGNTSNYEIIDINGSELTLTAMDREGNEIDTFNLAVKDRLSAAKAAADAVLTGYYSDAYKYRQAQKEELALIVIKARADLKQALTVKEVIAIRKSVVTAIGKIKTDAQLTEIENAQKTLGTAGGLKTISTYSTASVSWKQNAYADGYELYRSSPSGNTFKLYKTMIGTATARFKDTALKTGTAYYYKVRAYKKLYGEKVYGSFSAVRSAKPSLAKTSVKLIAGKKKAIVKWSRIQGASGYEIYRAVKIKGKYKKIKTATSGKTLKYLNKRLKKGKRYFYKVRGYRNVSGKKIRGSFSSVKNIKIK